MIRIKHLNKISFQKKNNKYSYLSWITALNDGKLQNWDYALDLYEPGHTSLSPTLLVEWGE